LIGTKPIVQEISSDPILLATMKWPRSKIAEAKVYLWFSIIIYDRVRSKFGCILKEKTKKQIHLLWEILLWECQNREARRDFVRNCLPSWHNFALS